MHQYLTSHHFKLTTMKKLYASFLLCCAISSIHAQWTSNTNQNTLVADANSSDIQTANTNDGKTWIAFYSQRGKNYDMRAQLLDVNGNRLLGDSGIVVSDKKSGSATFVFNVCVDNDNNLIIAFQHQKGSSYECIIQKINTAGKLKWNNGVDLGPGLAPYPVALTTNDIAVAWSNNNKIDYQKISSSGVVAWSAYKEFSESSVSRPQLLADTKGDFSMVYQKLVYFPFYTNLYEQKFNTDGNAVWTNAVQISTLVTASYRYFNVHIDNDTTYVGYYGNPANQNRFDAYVQKIKPNGKLPWGKNGSAFADFSGDNDRFEQTIFIKKEKDSNNIWAVCTVTNSLQTTSGVYVQKFDAAGNRHLGGFAKELLPVTTHLTALAFSNLTLCSNEDPLFLVTDKNNKLAAVKLNSDGSFAWQDFIRYVGGSSNSKSRFGFTNTYNGQAVAVWQEDKGHGEMPYAQNINCVGSTGIKEQKTIADNKPALNTIAIKSIYPNPVQNVLTAAITSTKNSNIRIYITDVSGNVFSQFQQNIKEGNNSIQLNVSNLKAGSYFIKVMNGNASAAALFNK